ncbi:MAG TPA: LCP family protein [Chloroflexota bacterium]|nr:LCP family protein [Chloroflexota bacterium]
MSVQPAAPRPYSPTPLPRPQERAFSVWRPIRTLLFSVLGLILIVVLALGVLIESPPALEALSAITLKPQPGLVPWDGRDRITVVIMGLTQRTTEPARTDTLLVMDIDPAHHQVHMLSVPRDLWVNIPGYGQGKLAVAYEVGGPRLASYVLESDLGIPVDYSIALTFRNFIKIVNAMGGVTVNVPRELNDPLYPCLTGTAYCPIDIKAGVQHMNGATALEFVRERHAFVQQDLARVQDQQAFSEAVKQTLLSPAIWPRYPAILKAVENGLITNVPLNALPEIGLQVLLARGHTTHNYINIENGMVQPAWSNDGQSILLPTNSTDIPNLTHQLFSDPTIAAEAAPVEVLNGTSTTGVASSLEATLQGLGFHMVGAGNAAATDYRQTEVIVNTNATGPAAYTARRLQRLLDARLLHEPVPGQTARIVVIAGSDSPLVATAPAG